MVTSVSRRLQNQYNGTACINELANKLKAFHGKTDMNLIMPSGFAGNFCLQKNHIRLEIRPQKKSNRSTKAFLKFQQVDTLKIGSECSAKRIFHTNQAESGRMTLAVAAHPGSNGSISSSLPTSAICMNLLEDILFGKPMCISCKVYGCMVI